MNKFVVQVQFTEHGPNQYTNPKNYNFLTSDSTFQLGDKLVVDTANGLQVVTFVSYIPSDPEFGETFANKNAKWVICKVDVSEHQKRLQAEQRREELLKKMEVRRKKAEKLEIYRILASKDAEMAALLTELETLEV